MAKECGPKEFLDTNDTKPEDWPCCSCPVGSFCGSSVEKKGIVAMSGYYRVPETFFSDPNRSATLIEYGKQHDKDKGCTKAPVFVLCPYQERCFGYNTTSTPTQTGNSSSSDNKARENDEACPVGRDPDIAIPGDWEGCKTGTEGPMCALCAKGWAREGNACGPCTADALGKKAGLFATAACIIAIVVYNLRRFFKKFPRRLKKMKKDLFRILVIIINFSQIGTSLPTVFNVRWPENYLRLLDSLNVFNINLLELTGVSCATEIDHGAKLLAMACFPGVLVLYAVFKYLRNRCESYKRVHNSNEALHERLWHKASGMAFDVVDHEGDQSVNAGELIELFHHLGVKLDKPSANKIIMEWSDNKPLIVEDFHGREIMELTRHNWLRNVNSDLGHRLIHRKEQDKAIKWTDNFQTISVALASVGELMLAIHAPVSQAAFEWFWTTQLGNRYVLKVDPGVWYGDAYWMKIVPVALFVLLVLTIGLPLILFVGLLTHRQNLDSLTSLSRFGWMYDRYSPGAEWWGLHEVVRKCILTGMLIYINLIELRVAIAAFVSVIAVLNLNFWAPFRNKTVFWVSQAAFVTTTLKYLVAMFRLSNEHNPEADKWSEIVGTFLITMDVLTFLCFFVGGCMLVHYMVKELKKTRSDDMHDKVIRRKSSVRRVVRPGGTGSSSGDPSKVVPYATPPSKAAAATPTAVRSAQKLRPPSGTMDTTKVVPMVQSEAPAETKANGHFASELKLSTTVGFGGGTLSEESKAATGLATPGVRAAVPALSEERVSRLQNLPSLEGSGGEPMPTIDASEELPAGVVSSARVSRLQNMMNHQSPEGAEGGKFVETAENGNESLIELTVPMGSHPGQLISVVQENGEAIHVKVPKHMKPGMTFTVNRASLASNHMDL
jgi:hypothetical protein